MPCPFVTTCDGEEAVGRGRDNTHRPACEPALPLFFDLPPGTQALQVDPV